MKEYTDLEQSKKLAEILPIESADMCFTNDGTSIKIDANSYNVRKLMWKDVQLIPCWSLAALLEEMNRNDYNISLRNNADLTWTISFNDSERYIDVYGKDLVDICFKMIFKLHEQKLI